LSTFSKYQSRYTANPTWAQIAKKEHKFLTKEVGFLGE
jgi:hypothetical protein